MPWPYKAAACVVLIYIIFVLYLWHTLNLLRQHETHTESDKADFASPPSPPSPPPADASVSWHTAVTQAIDPLQEENLRELMRDRIDCIGRSMEGWALEVVDTIDEITRLIDTTEQETEKESIRKVVAALTTLLTEAGCELINDDEWNPDRQRAIKVERVLPKDAKPRIKKKIRQGVIVRGVLIRKQDVSTEMPSQSEA